MTLRWDAEYLKLMEKYVKMAEKDVFLCPKNGIPHKENINMRCDEAKSKENRFDENGKSTPER